MDVVCPIEDISSKWNNFELVIMLRSLSKYVSGIDRVLIVSKELPSFLKNVIHIKCIDNLPFNRDGNIMEKVLAACNCESLSDDFLFMNDDHVFCAPVSVSGIKPFSRGILENHGFMKESSVGYNTVYGRRLRSTFEFLKSKGASAFHYDIHCPIIFNKTKFKEVLSISGDWRKIHYVMKSLYGNLLNLGEFYMEDLKIMYPVLSFDYIERKIAGRWCFSYSDGGLRGGVLKEFLVKKFSTKSVYES